MSGEWVSRWVCRESIGVWVGVCVGVILNGRVGESVIYRPSSFEPSSRRCAHISLPHTQSLPDAIGHMHASMWIHADTHVQHHHLIRTITTIPTLVPVRATECARPAATRTTLSPPNMLRGSARAPEDHCYNKNDRQRSRVMTLRQLCSNSMHVLNTMRIWRFWVEGYLVKGPSRVLLERPSTHLSLCPDTIRTIAQTHT